MTTEKAMTFESDRQLREWGSRLVHPMLREVVTYGTAYAKTFGWTWHVIDIFRTKAEDKKLEGSGVHCVWRAMDVRTKDQVPKVVENVGKAINQAFLYGNVTSPGLMVARWDPHGTGPHMHLQVHPMTVRR